MNKVHVNVAVEMMNASRKEAVKTKIEEALHP